MDKFLLVSENYETTTASVHNKISCGEYKSLITGTVVIFENTDLHITTCLYLDTTFVNNENKKQHKFIRLNVINSKYFIDEFLSTDPEWFVIDTWKNYTRKTAEFLNMTFIQDS